jgi:hypothetical protein
MSFCIYDSNGYVGDLASNRGLDGLAMYIEKHPDADELGKLFKEGFILKTEHLLEEIKMIGAPKYPDIRATLNNLKTLIEKSTEIIIITCEAGMGEEE